MKGETWINFVVFFLRCFDILYCVKLGIKVSPFEPKLLDDTDRQQNFEEEEKETK